MNPLLEQAARWHARLQAPDCTQREREELASWLRSEANRQAYEAAERIGVALSSPSSSARLQAMAEQALALGRVQPVHGDAAAPADDADKDDPAAPGRDSDMAAVRSPTPTRLTWSQSRLVSGALAAGIVAAVLTLGFFLRSGSDASTNYAASGGAPLEFDLADGTRVHLDVGSAIEVDFAGSRRHVSLTRGRALFDVAHDPQRPFVVAAGARRVTALGTVFQVDRGNPQETTITLAEGAVLVSARLHGVSRSERLAPGEQVLVPENSLSWPKQKVDAEAATSWSDGRHVFRDRRLDDAVEEVNRYAARQIVLADPGLAGMEVSGSFVTGDSASIVQAFAAVLPIKVVESGEELLLFYRP